MIDKAVLENLKVYNWGQDTKLLRPIDEAIIATQKDAGKRKEVEGELAALLASDATYDGKQTVCRYLMAIGTAASVPALAALLSDEKLSHMARYALERMPAPEAGAALREALGKSSGKLKIGMISSLGGRRENENVAALAGLLSDGDVAVANAAAMALGNIRTADAAKALSAAPDSKAKAAATDASLACAEALLKAGKNNEALVIYKKFAGDGQPKHVKLAATRGVLACASKKE